MCNKSSMDSDFTDVLVSIHCESDGKVFQIPFGYLVTYFKFFEKQLSNFSTKRRKETIIKTELNGKQTMIDVYYIPQLSVQCSSNVLCQLIDPQSSDVLTIELPYNSDTIDLMMYNEMYDINKTIKLSGSNSLPYCSTLYAHKDLPVFIKKTFPGINVFTFMKNCSLLEWKDLILYYIGICGMNKYTDKIIVEDVLEYAEDCLCGTMAACYNPRDVVGAMCGISSAARDGHLDLVKKYISTGIIIRAIKIYIKNGCVFQMTGYFYGYVKKLAEFNVINLEEVMNSLHL